MQPLAAMTRLAAAAVLGAVLGVVVGGLFRNWSAGERVMARRGEVVSMR